MQALPGAGGPRLLRIGVVQGGRVLEDRIIRERRAVTVGASERADFVIASDEIGTTVSLFETDGPDYFLHVSEGMTGRVALEGGIADVTTLRGRVRLTDASRGKITLGDVTFLFELVLPPR
jgi:hypothetical protein